MQVRRTQSEVCILPLGNELNYDIRHLNRKVRLPEESIGRIIHGGGTAIARVLEGIHGGH